MTGVPPTTITIGERILLHLSRYRWISASAPFELTQDGIAQAIGRTRAHAAIELKKLIDQGKVEAPVTDHVVGGAMKRKVYIMTPAGWAAASRLKWVLADRGIDWVSAIRCPSTPRSDLAKLGEKITRMQNELDNLKVAFAGLQGGTA